jgi:hypothetical protein
VTVPLFAGEESSDKQLVISGLVAKIGRETRVEAEGAPLIFRPGSYLARPQSECLIQRAIALNGNVNLAPPELRPYLARGVRRHILESLSGRIDLIIML